MSWLDDPRVLFAAERTLLAWQRTAIALIAFGFMVERFALFSQMVPGKSLSLVERGGSLAIAVALILLGSGVAFASALQFRRTVKHLGEAEIPRGYWVGMGPATSYALAAIGLALAGYFVFSPA